MNFYYNLFIKFVKFLQFVSIENIIKIEFNIMNNITMNINNTKSIINNYHKIIKL